MAARCARIREHEPLALTQFDGASCCARAISADAFAAQTIIRAYALSRLNVIVIDGQCVGSRGLTLMLPPRTRNPQIDSIAARCIQAADPVYQLQPPRPT